MLHAASTTLRLHNVMRAQEPQLAQPANRQPRELGPRSRPLTAQLRKCGKKQQGVAAPSPAQQMHGQQAHPDWPAGSTHPVHYSCSHYSCSFLRTTVAGQAAARKLSGAHCQLPASGTGTNPHHHAAQHPTTKLHAQAHHQSTWWIVSSRAPALSESTLAHSYRVVSQPR